MDIGTLVAQRLPSDPEILALSEKFGTPPEAMAMRSEADVFYDGDGSMLTFAPTGAGKFLGAVAPQALAHKGLLIAVDTKFEIAPVVARHRSKMGPVFIIDMFGKVPEYMEKTPQISAILHQAIRRRSPDDKIATHYFNVLGSIDPNSADASAQCDALADSLVARPSGNSDPFWRNSARGRLAMAIKFVLACGKMSTRNLRTVVSMLSKSGPERDAILSAMEHCDDANSIRPAPPALARSIRQGLAEIRSTGRADGTDAGVDSHLKESLSLLDRSVLDAMSPPPRKSAGSCDWAQVIAMRELPLELIRSGATGTILFHVPPQYLESHRSVLNMWIDLIINTIASRAADQRPQHDTVLLLDEAGQYLKGSKSVRMALTLLRGHGLKLHLVYQSPSMLLADFPQDWRTIIENAGVLRAFGFRSGSFVKGISEILGVSEEGLLGLPDDIQLISLVSGGAPFLAKRPNYLHDLRLRAIADDNPWHASKARVEAWSPIDLQGKIQPTLPPLPGPDDDFRDVRVRPSKEALEWNHANFLRTVSEVFAEDEKDLKAEFWTNLEKDLGREILRDIHLEDTDSSLLSGGGFMSDWLRFKTSTGNPRWRSGHPGYAGPKKAAKAAQPAQAKASGSPSSARPAGAKTFP